MASSKERLTDEKVMRVWAERFGDQERIYYSDIDRERCWLRRDSEAEFNISARRERGGSE